MQPVHLTGLSQAELSDFVASLGEPEYRSRQIFSAIHARRVTSFEAMTDLPKELRAVLDDRAVISTI